MLFKLSKANTGFICLAVVFLFNSSKVYAEKNSINRSYEPYMRKLIKLSQKNPKFPFAAMIIDNKTGKILCTGVNAAATNPTYHGEIVAINNCVAKHPKIDWSTTTLITDAEPCVMCTGAIIWAGISKIVYGTSIPFFTQHNWEPINVRAKDIMKQASFYQGKILGGVLHDETDKLFEKPPEFTH